MEPNLIDRIQDILTRSMEAAEEAGITVPAVVRIHPDVLFKISLIPNWFGHALFHTQDSGALRTYGPNASSNSPVINRVFVRDKALRLIEDPHAYFVTLELGSAW